MLRNSRRLWLGFMLLVAAPVWAQQATVSLTPDRACYAVDSTVTVTIDLSAASGVDSVIGGQFRLWYDVSKLTYVSAAAAPTIFTELLAVAVDGPNIDLAVGVPGNVPGPGALSGTMAVLTFTATAEACQTSELIRFRADEPPQYTRLSGVLNEEVVSIQRSDLTQNALPSISVDDTEPAISGSVSDYYDGELNSTCQSVVQIELSVSDECCLALTDVQVQYDITGGTYDAAAVATTQDGNAVTISGTVLLTRTSGCDLTFSITVSASDCCSNAAVPFNWSRSISDETPPALAPEDVLLDGFVEDFKANTEAKWECRTLDWDCDSGAPAGDAIDGPPGYTAGFISAPIPVSACPTANALYFMRTSRALDLDAAYDGSLLGDLTGLTLMLRARLSKPDMTPGEAFGLADFAIPPGVNPRWNPGLGLYIKGTGNVPEDDYWYYVGAPRGIEAYLDATQLRNGVWAALAIDLTDAAKWGNVNGQSASLPPWNARWMAAVADVDELRISLTGGDTVAAALAFASGQPGTLDVDFITPTAPQITASADPGVCSATLALPVVTATDNCDTNLDVTYLVGETPIASPYGFPWGATIVRASATDGCANVGQWNFTVIVSDDENPALTPPSDVAVQCAADVPPFATNVTEYLLLPGADVSDNCTAQPNIALAHVSDVSDGHTCPEVITRTYRAQDESGNAATTVQHITVDDTFAPSVTDCPAALDLNADAGTCEKSAIWTAPTVSDNCTASPAVEYDIDLYSDTLVDDTVVATAYTFPVGIHTVMVRATDDCGNVNNTCSFTVSVSPLNEVLVDLALNGALDSTTFTRCVRFWLSDCAGGTETVQQEVTFTNGTATDVALLVDCRVYDCIMAEDPLHTLRRRIDAGPAFDIVNGQYVASFTGANELVQGDLYNDLPGESRDVIDILDFGVYVTQWGHSYDPATCATAFPHADVSGDGFVDVSDFSYIQLNFFDLGDPACCVAGLGPEDGEPRTSVTLAELEALGLSELAVADLNGDGVVDLTDVAAWLNGVRPDQPVTRPSVVPAGSRSQTVPGRRHVGQPQP